VRRRQLIGREQAQGGGGAWIQQGTHKQLRFRRRSERKGPSVVPAMALGSPKLEQEKGWQQESLGNSQKKSCKRHLEKGKHSTERETKAKIGKMQGRRSEIK